MVIPEVKTSSMNNWDGEEVLFEIDRDDDSMKKIVGILTSDLYKNKPGAVVRELSTNCLDAHRMIDSEEKFTIQIPTTYNNNFLVIRDYGPGLSREDMVNLYSKYGKSTKDQVNDFTGCLGLGSKSPLSICSNFMVTSYHEDEVNTYSVYLNPDGQPALQMIGSMKVHTEIEDDEENKKIVSSRLLLKSDYDDYNWYKNFLIAKMTSDNKLVFGIKLKPYYQGIISDVVKIDPENESSPEKIVFSNKIELNLHILDNNLKLFKTIMVFNDKKLIDGYPKEGLELNERLQVVSETKEIHLGEKVYTPVAIENIDYSALDTVEQSRHNDGFSFFSIDLSTLVPEIGTNGYFIEAVQPKLAIEDEGQILKETVSSQKYQQLLNYTYDLEFRTGLKIEIPVSTQYRTQIIKEVNEQLLFFPITPRVIEMKSTGPEQKTEFNFSYIEQEKVAIEVAPGVKLIKKNNLRPNSYNQSSNYSVSQTTLNDLFGRRGNGGCLLVQGGVSYPVELDLVQTTVKSTSRDPRFKIDMTDFAAFELYIRYLSDQMVLFFDIGEISFNPSREGLNYDALTCIKIYDKIRQVLVQYKKDMMDFLEYSMDELELERRYHSLKETYSGLSLLSQFNSNNQYISELAKTIKTVTLKDGVVYDLQNPGMVKKIFSLFRPINEINDILKVKTKLDRPAFWELNRNATALYIPYDYRRVVKAEAYPYFVLVDGKKYRRVISEHLREIVNHKFENHYKAGLKAVSSVPNGSVNATTATSPQSMYRKTFLDVQLQPANSYYYDISRNIYIIFEDHLNLTTKPEDQSTEDYICEVLGLNQTEANAKFFPRVLNYKKELKLLLDSGKIVPPTKERSQAFTGLGYSIPYSRFNVEESSSVSWIDPSNIVSKIKNKSLDEKFELDIDADEVEDFIQDLESGKTLLIPYDNKTKQIIYPSDNIPTGLSFIDEYKQKLLGVITDNTLSNELGSYLWFLKNCGIIDNNTNIVYGKISVIQKMGIEKYNLFESSRLLNHLESIIKFHFNLKLTKFDDRIKTRLMLGTDYTNFEKILDVKKDLNWKNLKAKPITMNVFPKGKSFKNLPVVAVPSFGMDYFIMKEALNDMILTYQPKYNINRVTGRIDATRMVSYFHKLYYNMEIYKNLEDILKRWEEKQEKIKLEGSTTVVGTKTFVYDFIRSIPEPEFGFTSITLSDMDQFNIKYPLLGEYLSALNDSIKAYTTQKNINDLQRITNKFLKINQDALDNMMGLFMNLFEVNSQKGQTGENLTEEGKNFAVFSNARLYGANLSLHATKGILRKYIIGNPIFKKRIKAIKNEIHHNAMKDMQEIERKIFEEENIKRWFIENKLSPAFGFNQPKELLSICA